jgi:LCP family protein required for cell wall assembly
VRLPGLRRLWRHRWAKVVAITTAVLLVAGAAGGGWIVWRYSQVHRYHDLPVAAAPDGDPQNFLLVGSDSRAFVEGDADVTAYGTADEVGAPHADTILLVRIFPALDRVAMVSFPRDLWLTIPGTGGEDRINTTVDGGPDRLIKTITENFGIPVHHYAQIDFRGFKGLVNAIDGVNVYFPAPVRDFDRDTGRTLTGLDIPNAGCIRLDGDQALAYVRSRHYEQLVEGEWQPDPAGDLNRIQRQQDFIRRTFHQTLSKGLLDPRRVDKLLSVAIGNVTLDDSLGFRDLVRLGGQFRSLTPDALQTYALPTTPGTTAGGASVLFLDEEAAQPVLDVFRGRTVEPPTTLASSVRVQVLNASGRSGEVRVAAYRLAAAGFSVPGIGTLPVRLDRTRIRFGTGQEGAAELLAAQVRPKPELVGDPTIVGVDVVLDIGRDWQRVVDPAEADDEGAVTTTTTTAAGVEGSTSAPTSVPAPPSTTTTTADTTVDPVDAAC